MVLAESGTIRVFLTDLLWLPYPEQTICGAEGRSKGLVNGATAIIHNKGNGSRLGWLEYQQMLMVKLTGSAKEKYMESAENPKRKKNS